MSEVFICSACGAPAADGAACAGCGGALVKICPKCQFKNSATKKYCDRCGTELLRAGEPTKPAGAPDAVIPQTVIVRKAGAKPPKQASDPGAQPQGPEAGTSLPQAGRSVPAFASAPTKPPVSAKPVVTGRKGPSALERTKDAVAVGISSLSYVLKSSLAIVFLLFLALCGFLLFQEHRRLTSPAFAVKATAETYLEMMKGGDYANAYTMLTPAAQQMTTLDEFRQARDPRNWSWSKVRAASIEPGSALAVYELAVDGQLGSESDYMFFTLQGDKWLRPYNWTLLQKAEASLRANDPDMAILRAQAAVQINPRDPVARSYLCEANYFRRLLPDADRECRMTLALADKYPSQIKPRALRHIAAILADTLAAGGRPGDAAATYDRLLAAPDLSALERCDALKARAGARQALGQAEAAKADLQAASRACAAVPTNP